MEFEAAGFAAPIGAYERQAEELLEAHRAGDAGAIALFHRKHPRFLDEKVKWLPKSIPDAEIRDAALTLDDARLAIARAYDFRDWDALHGHVAAVSRRSEVFAFECAVEAVVNGNLAALREGLRRDPELIRARSARVCCFDPPVHRATLLHYLAANGVEQHRQKSRENAVEIARTLLEAGADADALADMYGAECTTMSMLVSSSPPARAGVQVGLIDVLLDFGADVEGRGTRKWGGPIVTALLFGMMEAAQALKRRGARIDLIAAAGLGMAGDVARLIPGAEEGARQRALALAAQHGQAHIAGMFLDTGEDPNRYNPEGWHGHATPLHQAVLGGHDAAVRILVERGARLDVRDRIWKATPLGWALHGGGKRGAEMAEYLRSRGAAE